MLMKIFENGEYTGERALYALSEAEIRSCRFFDGESPLKESNGLNIESSTFEWKYPLWYCRDIKVSDSLLKESARSGIWYTQNIEMKNILCYNL